ncbi:Uma2 family endonuclease [Streptomyces sp. NPDC004539]|uniref:Uma2 family endonuclease n=1 Tax=Streptomyces sp. NPDC004539 TaxID=3154280 RepID=UPI0033BECED5
MNSGPEERPYVPAEDFEEVVAAAPEHIRLELVDGRVRTKDPLGVEEFEVLERRAPETVQLEYAYGELEFKAFGDGTHSCIRIWLLRQFLALLPDQDLYPEVGVRTEADGRGRYIPDGVLAPSGHFAGQGGWADPGGVLMALEITSRDGRTNRRARFDKPFGYAEAGVPVYLLVDRNSATSTVHSEPVNGRYQHVRSCPWKDALRLPLPLHSGPVTLPPLPAKYQTYRPTR